jgi:signal transduction histidine kinase
VSEIQSMMVGLRSQALEQMDLIEALRAYLDTIVARHGLKTRFEVLPHTGRVPQQVAYQLYRIAQGALSNVLKWAEASKVTVTLAIRKTRVTLYIRDNGHGFDPSQLEPSKGFGLASMQQRASALGGTMTLESEPGQGTTITVIVPRRA